MVDNYDEAKLSKLLKAVSDTTRRTLLTRLCQQGASRVTDIAKTYDMSLNAVSKHIKVLEKVALVKRRTAGRVHWIEADLEEVVIIQTWVRQLTSVWELRLNKLNEILTENDNE